MSSFQNSFSRGLRLSIGALLLIAAVWAVTSASNGWSRIWLVQKQPTVKRPEFVVMDSQIANDPAMQATKLKGAGPIAQLIEKSEDSGAIDPDGAPAEDSGLPAASPASSSSTPTGMRQRYIPNTQNIIRLCSGKITFARSKALAFRVPANVSFPRLKGEFTSLAQNGSTHSIDVLLLSEQQYADFRSGSGVDSLLENEGSSAEIDFALSPTVAQPRQYYLVLKNLSDSAVTVNARFVVNLD